MLLYCGMLEALTKILNFMPMLFVQGIWESLVKIPLTPMVKVMPEIPTQAWITKFPRGLWKILKMMVKISRYAPVVMQHILDLHGTPEALLKFLSLFSECRCIGENSKLNPDGEGVAENSNSSTHRTDGDATLPGFSGDAGGSDKNSKLSPDDEGAAGNPNSSTDIEMHKKPVGNTKDVVDNSVL